MAYKYKFGNFTYEFVTPSNENPLRGFSRELRIIVRKNGEQRRLILRLASNGFDRLGGRYGIDVARSKFDLSKERELNKHIKGIPSKEITGELRGDILKTVKKRYKDWLYKPIPKSEKTKFLKKYTKEEIEKSKKRGERLLKSAHKKKVVRKKTAKKKPTSTKKK
jgi:hypothetical protein